MKDPLKPTRAALRRLVASLAPVLNHHGITYHMRDELPEAVFAELFAAERAAKRLVAKLRVKTVNRGRR